MERSKTSFQSLASGLVLLSYIVLIHLSACACVSVTKHPQCMGCQFNRKIESRLCDYDTYYLDIMHVQVTLTTGSGSAASESILAMTVNRVHACMQLD